MIFCSKPFKYAFKTTRILSEMHIAPNFKSKAYGLNKSIFSVKLLLGQIGLWDQRFSSDVWFLSFPRVIGTTLKISDLRLTG